MRAAAGLPLPERQIGLAARPLSLEPSPPTGSYRPARGAMPGREPSRPRWLSRMLNLMGGLPDRGGPEALARMRARGAEWLALAQAVARPPAPVPPAARPSPIPPLPLFADLPVTDVSLADHDYAVLCQARAGLRRAATLRPQPDASLRGRALHAIVEALLHSRPTPDTPPEVLRDRFLALTDRVLADEVPWPAARAFWSARIARIADRIVADELTRLAEGRPMVVEHRGKVPVADLGT